MSNLIFLNHFHNGDVHLSRSMVRHLCHSISGYNYLYSHGNPANLLADMANIKFVPNLYLRLPQDLDVIIDPNGDIALSTWVGACGNRFNEGCTIQSIYNMFDYYSYHLIGTGMPILEHVLPMIDFSKFYTKPIDDFFKHRNAIKKVFISNGYALSGQASNFNMSTMAEAMASQYPNYDFFLTNKELPLVDRDNLFYTEDVMCTQGQPDLNENAYLSTYCDVIIGRSSGAFSFALNISNFYRDVIFYSVQSTSGFNGFNSIPGLTATFEDINDIGLLIKKIGE